MLLVQIREPLRQSSSLHDYKQEAQFAEDFLRKFKSNTYKGPYRKSDSRKYLSEIQKIKDKKNSSLEINLEDLEDYFQSKGEKERMFLRGIMTNTRRYLEMFEEVANYNFEEIKRSKPLTEEEEFDQILEEQRLEALNKDENEKNKQLYGLQNEKLKKILKQKFPVIIVPGPNGKKLKTNLRDLKADKIGSLVSVRAIVVKVSEVQPQIDLACFICENCQWECYKKVSAKQFDPPTVCNSEKCLSNKTRGNLIQNYAMSRFEAYQEAIVQEISDEAPIGQIPRTMKIYMKGDKVRKCSPGDMIDIDGVYISQKIESRNIRSDPLVQDTLIQVLKTDKVIKSYEDVELNQKTLKSLITNSKKKGHLNKLANSICPEIFGMTEVKKALLLQLVGGTTIKLPDKVMIRGNINIGLIGDPGVAKSQLLKFIAHITPRGIYTTGKGSSGAGLTATISRDQVSGEITLEGGALVLADQGICCIDEFDKMEEQDRVAIHEVMEQQTVSLAKGGITTRLNARCSVLAAANPIQGRYNPTKSPHENINLPYSLLSRFDLMFILLDQPNEVNDHALARHITFVHSNKHHPQNNKEIYNEQKIRAHISYARKFKPTIKKELHEYIIDKYVEKRLKNKNEQCRDYQYITPRSLLGVIRLSLALAKLRFTDQVSKTDIDEAISLLESAQENLDKNDQNQRTQKMNQKKDLKSRIYIAIKNTFKKFKNKYISKEVLENEILSKGFTLQDFNKVVQEYEKLGLIMKNNEGNELSIIQII